MTTQQRNENTELSLEPTNDIDTMTDVQVLVDSFYDKVRVDPDLGYIFDEVSQVNWSSHLPLMYSFWGAILLKEPGYFGKPFPIHHKVNDQLKSIDNIGLQHSHFDRWLELFNDTVDRHFVGVTADQAKLNARHIKERFESLIIGDVSIHRV